MKNIATQVIRFRWLVILFFLGATGFFASRLPTVELDPSLKGLLPDDVPSRLNLTKIEEIFGGTDMLMLTLVHDDVLQADTLRRTRTLSRKLERLKGVDRVVSLFTLKDIRSSDGDMVVESAVLKIPATKEEREKLRERLKANDLIYGNVVSKDFKATAIMALLKDNGVDDDVLMASVHSLIAENPGPEEILFAGLPYLRTLVAADMQNDLRRFLPLGILVMLIFLFAAFRQLRGVLLPFVVVLMSIFVGIGVIPLLGWKIQLVTVLLPVMLIAIGNDYGIHIYARYQEENLPGSTLSSKELAAIVFQDLTIPVFLTGLTTMAGMLSLLAHIVVPSQQLGILAAIAIMWALAASLLFIPAVLSLLPVAKPLAHLDKKATKKPFLERVLDATAELVVTKPKGVVAAFALVALLVSFGISLLIVDTNPVNYYPEDAPVHAANDLVNEEFGGSTGLSLVATGDIKSPEVLAQIEALQTKLDGMPSIGQTTSVVDVVKKMNRVMHDDRLEQEVIPQSRDAVAQYFLMYSLSGDPEDLDQLVDFPFENAQIMARISSTSTSEIAKVVEEVESIIKEDANSPFTLVGGFGAILSEVVDAVITGQIWSLIFSFTVVVLMVGAIFLSPVAGLLAGLPLGLAIILLFGLMGLFKIELNATTAMLSSIMIGVGIDYTIHFLWRYKKEVHAGRDALEAVRSTMKTTGRGIVFNALSVIVGFTVLMFSAFLPVKYFGFLIVVSIGVCLVGALVLLPAILILTKPSFIFAHPKTK